MPVNVVKTPRDERLWDKAKQQAAKQGRDKDWAYIMGIYQKMTGGGEAKKSLLKAFMVPAEYRTQRVYGQIPKLPIQTDEALAIRLAETPPKPYNVAQLLTHDEPRFTPEAVAGGLGLDQAQENEWARFVRSTVGIATNEIQMRKALYEKFMEDRTEPALRQALFQRSMKYWESLRKGMVEIVTPDELCKADPRGGSYYRRTPDGDGGYRYFYSKDDYEKRDDKHIDGAEAMKAQIKRAVYSVLEKDETGAGVAIEDFQKLSAKYGADKVAAVLKDEHGENGGLLFQKGRFYRKAVAKSLQKSMKPGQDTFERFIITR